MAWTSPMTAAANTVFTSAQWNANVRDNLNVTMTGLAAAAGDWFVSDAVRSVARRIPTGATTTGSSTTASATYTNLADLVSTSVTATTGTSALVFYGAEMSAGVATNTSYVSVAVSGATTLAASDDWGLWIDGVTAANVCRSGMVKLFTTLTAGSNVFTLKYKTSAGTSTYVNRHICVIPF